MNFPVKYDTLTTNTFLNGVYQLVPIRYEDRLEIMKWRNEQIYHLRQEKPLTPKDQENYFQHIISKLFEQEKPNQLLFSFLKDGKCIGYGGLVHINWVDKNAEISFIMETALEKEHFSEYWQKYLHLIEKVAFEELNLHKIYTYAFDLRPHLYEAIENAGYLQEAVLKEHCLFEGKFIDVVIHCKINLLFSLRKVNEHDLDSTFEWANDEDTRKNSFYSEPISYLDHKTWFYQKLADLNSTNYIVVIENESAGLVRFDTQENQTTIGILISKKFRGKGLANCILRESCNEFLKISNAPIIAFIKLSNITSIKSFEKAGFRKIEQVKVNGIDAYKYQYEH